MPKKTCWDCRFFGKCRVEVKGCDDWEIYNETEAVANIDQFAVWWLKQHNSGWFRQKFDPEIMKVRREAFRKWEEGDDKEKE